MIIDISNEIRLKWNTLCEVHNLTKKYMLLSEEYSVDMKTYIQPMKEQKDAYEHIVRAYSVMYNNIENTSNKLDKKDEQYLLKNLDKAISHEYRAFYDTIDYFTLILRNLFYNELKFFSGTEILKVYPHYREIKNRLLELPEKIAIQRNNKDIGNSDPVALASEYTKVLDDLLNDYKSLMDNVLCKIKIK